MKIKIWAQDGVLRRKEGARGNPGESKAERRREKMKTYLALELANQQSLEDLARLVRVADVLEGFG
jgi:hypothetical protein